MSVKRKTKSLGLILSIFENSTEAISVVDLITKFKGDMNKTTVYRILERLESEGAIHSFLGANGLTWYAKCQQCNAHHHNDIHPHFQCEDCGKVECLEINIPIPTVDNKIIQSANVLLKGQCADCI